MPVKKGSAKNTSTDTQITLHVTKNQKKHDINLIGTPIAEMEVTPHNDSLMSLGIFEESRQPHGFSIEYHYKGDRPENIESKVTTKTVKGGSLYILRIANSTNYAVCAEVRML